MKVVSARFRRCVKRSAASLRSVAAFAAISIRSRSRRSCRIDWRKGSEAAPPNQSLDDSAADRVTIDPSDLRKPRLAVTLGDVRGIGPEIVLKAAASRAVRDA